jgi:tRNA uracil 4-sulfurtransferase
VAARLKIHVRLYSLVRERAGAKELELELPAAATVAHLIDALTQAKPALASLLSGQERLPVLVAVNRAYAEMGHALRDGDEVALFPPVSGGSGRKGLLLLSGGFDSPVAGKWALEAGHSLEAVHFSFEPFTDDASSRKATELARILGLAHITIVPLGPALSEVAKRCEPRCYFVLQKRLMYRIAERLASRQGSTFLVTGENLGQVSSQTLPNLGTIDAVATLPVVRPLLGLDKQDIITAARRIGTFEASKGPEVCDVLGPKHPSTSVPLEKVLAQEAKVDVELLVSTALEGAWTVDTERGFEPRTNAASQGAPAC